MRNYIFQIIILVLFISFPQFIKADDAVEKTRQLIREITDKSYPELKNAKIEVKTFHSDSDYFRSQFSFSRYLTMQKMHYIIYVNPEVYTKKAPENGIRSIVAHELAHALYFKNHN